MNNSLNNKLDRVDSAIAMMRNNLKINANAPVEDVVKATQFGIKELINIYIQEEEPASKDGIWLQTAPFEYDTFTVDEDCKVKDTIEKTLGSHEYTGYDSTNKILADKNYIYHCYNKNIYRHNIETGTRELIGSLPNNISSFTIYNDKIYLVYVSQTDFVEYDLNTNEYKTILNLPFSSNTHAIGRESSKVAIFGRNQGILLDLKTLTYVNMPAYPQTYCYGGGSYACTLPSWGGLILTPVFGYGASSPVREYCGFLDPETNTFSWLPHPGGYWEEIVDNAIVGNVLYRINSRENGIMVYQLPSQGNSAENKGYIMTGYDFRRGGLTNAKESLYTFTGIGSGSQVYKIASETSSYDENTLVLIQGRYKTTKRDITLFSLPETSVGKLQWSFNDIFPCVDGQLLTNIPTYYGNGTEWIKYKN